MFVFGLLGEAVSSPLLLTHNLTGSTCQRVSIEIVIRNDI